MPAPPSAPFLGQGAAGPSLGSSPLLLTPGRGPWTWCISAARLGCRNGRIVPLPAVAYHAPGLSANVRGDHGQGYISQLKRQGYVEIEHTYGKPVAFGQERAAVPPSTYLIRWQGANLAGQTVYRWTDAWKRPVQFGHQVIWERDDEGYDAFLQQALIDLCNDGEPLSDLQIRMATVPMIDRIKGESSRESPSARKIVRQLALHLPREHHTADVRDILDRMEIVLPEPTE